MCVHYAESLQLTTDNWQLCKLDVQRNERNWSTQSTNASISHKSALAYNEHTRRLHNGDCGIGQEVAANINAAIG
jgi:hypothetical protein